jgi:hypothetical protein
VSAAPRRVPRQWVRFALSALALFGLLALALSSCQERAQLRDQLPAMQVELDALRQLEGATTLLVEPRPGLAGVVLEGSYGVAQAQADLTRHFGPQLLERGWRPIATPALRQPEDGAAVYCKAPYKLEMRWLEANAAAGAVYQLAVGYGDAVNLACGY